MTKTQFAQNNGFSSYDELIMSSKVVVKEKNKWLVTRIEDGFLAWTTKSLDKPLGYFDTFDLAKREIIDAIIGDHPLQKDPALLLSLALLDIPTLSHHPVRQHPDR